MDHPRPTGPAFTPAALGKRAEFSTFRRTLAAALRGTLKFDAEDDPRLDTWIRPHLRGVVVPVPDADRLGRIEAAVLRLLDPPLNPAGMPPRRCAPRLSARADGSRPRGDDDETRTWQSSARSRVLAS